jgi:IclR family pca regulon transcriptional regulator
VVIDLLAIGSRLPAYPTSMGSVLLAGLSADELETYLSSTPLESLTSRTVADPDRLREVIAEVRSQGFALVDRELEDGVRSVAAPVTDRRDKVIAALNISYHAARTEMSTIRDDFVPQVIDAAAKISRPLPHRPPARLRARGEHGGPPCRRDAGRTRSPSMCP